MRNQRVQQVITRVRRTFDGFTNGQRAVTIIAVVVAIVGGVFFYQWAAKPSMSPLFTTALSASDASAVVTKLQESGVAYELDSAGTTIKVPDDKVAQTRIDLAGAGLPAETKDSGGYASITNAPLTTSDAQQRILIKQATEGELKKSIEKIDTVQEATVQLALPENDVFTSEQAAPKASVMIRPKPNQTLTASQVEAIVHLVSSSIPKLDANNVTVTDSDGKLLSGSGSSGSGVSEARVAQQAAISSGISRTIQAMLDKTVGSGNSSVAVNADLNYDNTRIIKNEYLQPPANAKPLQSDTSTETMTGSGNTPVGGVLGPDNVPVPSASAAGGKSDYKKGTTKEINAIGTQQTTTDAATGGIRRVNVAVALDSRTTGAVNQAAIQQLVCGAAGIDAQRGDTCTVTKMPFDTQAAQAKAAEQAAIDAQKRQDDLIGLAKNIGLGLLLLLALLIGFRQSRKKTVVDAGELESVETPMLPELPGGAHAAIEAGRPAEFELDDDLRVLEATPVDPQGQARVEAREEISTLVEENPDEVARLLRGWMAERN